MSTTALAFLFALLLLLLSSLAKEYIPAACFLLALLASLATVASQHRRLENHDHEYRATIAAQERLIEKREDEYRGQRSINAACLERHNAALSKLEQKLAAAVAKPCRRVHWEERDAITESRYKHLKDFNADLTRRIAGQVRRDAKLQERLDAATGDKETLRADLKRINDEMVAWRTDAIDYKRLWRKEGEKNSKRPAAAATADAETKTAACDRPHYENHDAAATLQENEKLQKLVSDLQQEVQAMQTRDGLWQDKIDVIQQQRNSLRSENERLENEKAHLEKGKAYSESEKRRRENEREHSEKGNAHLESENERLEEEKGRLVSEKKHLEKEKAHWEQEATKWSVAWRKEKEKRAANDKATEV